MKKKEIPCTIQCVRWLSRDANFAGRYDLWGTKPRKGKDGVYRGQNQIIMKRGGLAKITIESQY